MTSWVSSTLHISGFLSCPSYAIACNAVQSISTYCSPKSDPEHTWCLLDSHPKHVSPSDHHLCAPRNSVTSLIERDCPFERSRCARINHPYILYMKRELYDNNNAGGSCESILIPSHHLIRKKSNQFTASDPRCNAILASIMGSPTYGVVVHCVLVN